MAVLGVAVDQRVVLFVCPHGAGKSRMAAAWFDGVAVPGWAASSAAGVQPQATVSEHAKRLLARTSVRTLLDETRPRPLPDVLTADLIVAIDCPDTVEATLRWELAHQRFDEAMCAEIRDRVHALAASLPAAGPP